MQLFRMYFFYFVMYSFLGWILEGTFNLVTRGHFTKPNFLILPLKPMYGIASTLLIILSKHLTLPFFLLSALVVPTTIEFLTAYILNHTMGLKYWDYSSCAHQISGYICLRFSLYWFILSLFLIYGIQPFIASLYLNYPQVWYYLFPISFILLLVDFTLTLYDKEFSHNLFRQD